MVNIVGTNASIFTNDPRNPFSRLRRRDLLRQSPTKIVVFDLVSGINFSFFGQRLDPNFDPPRGVITRLTNASGLNVTGFQSPLFKWFDVFLGLSTFNSLIGDILKESDDIRGSSKDDRLYGYNGNDLIVGKGGDDLLSGGNQNDTIIGGTGDDAIFGGTGNDILLGQSGRDSFNGGNGVDTVRYQGSNAGVVANLTTGRGSGGDAQGDTLINIENLNGSDLNDRLIGNSGNNQIVGLAGNDRLLGENGNDILAGRSGTDLIKGGSGRDEFRYLANNDSLLTSRDRILDLQIGMDMISFPTPISKNRIANKGQINTFGVASITNLLSDSFPANRGATFRFESRTYLAVNDNRNGFQASSDSIIDITGFSGSLSNLSIV